MIRTAQSKTLIAPQPHASQSIRDSVVHVPMHITDASLTQETRKVEVTPFAEPFLDWANNISKLISKKPGFVCLKINDDGYTNQELRCVYAAIARSLGSLNHRYGEFFDVKDRGLDHTKDAVPVSKTRASTGFHTDSSAANYCPDVVGLLCLQPAHSGGESLLADAEMLHDWITLHHPESLSVLTRPLYRDVITPGTNRNSSEIRKNAFPIFSRTENSFQFRYMRFWIETAYQKLGEPLPQGLRHAMNLIDSYLLDPNNTYCRMLTRGEILFVNNRRMCHSRTAFIDSSKQSQKRTLVRTWIDDMQHPIESGALIKSSKNSSTTPKSSENPDFDPALAS